MTVRGDDGGVDDAQEALDRLAEIGRQKWPNATSEQQFANAFVDPANANLAKRAHRRPAPTTSYEYPRSVHKAAPTYVGGEAARDVDDATDALGQLNALVEEQRERWMSVEQAFAAVYTNPANRHLAARELRGPGFS